MKNALFGARNASSPILSAVAADVKFYFESSIKLVIDCRKNITSIARPLQHALHVIRIEFKLKAMPKKNIHPKQHGINIVMTDGTKFQILTNFGKEGDTLKLDVDPKNHSAWQEKGQNFINANDERVTKFKKKFGNFDFA
jgi:large subunit ribosomal protein L31